MQPIQTPNFTQTMKQDHKVLTLKTLNKSNIWDAQENDIFRLWESGEKEADFKDNLQHYMDIIKSGFELEEIKIDNPKVFEKYEERGFKIGQIKLDDKHIQKWAVKKRPINRVTDLTYENIRHISAAKLMEVLERNFGGGWESLSQSIQDIILSGFDISTTTLPANRLHKPGGMYEKKVNDGFEVLEIPKGSWVEAIFAKLKPEVEKPRYKSEFDEDDKKMRDFDEDEDDEELDDVNEDSGNDYDDDDDSYDEDKLTEESYRTTFDTDPEDLNMEAEDVAEEEY